MSPATSPDHVTRRGHAPRRPLTPEQQQLAADMDRWVPGIVRGAAGRQARARHGYDVLAAEARYGIVKAAQQYVDTRGASFLTYAWRVAHHHVRRYVAAAAEASLRWATMPEARGRSGSESPLSAFVPDHRGEDHNPALRVWLTPEYREQRQGLDWHARVVLYLRTVEGWAEAEVAACFGVSAFEVGRVVNQAVLDLAVARDEAVQGSTHRWGIRCGCGRSKDSGRDRCGTCAAAHRRRTSVAYALRRAAGRCVEGNCPLPPEPGHVRCAGHAARAQELVERWKDQKRAERRPACRPPAAAVHAAG